MNGQSSSTIEFASKYGSNIANPNVSFVPSYSQSGNPWDRGLPTNNNRFWVQPNRLSPDEIKMQGQIAFNSTRPADPWGLAGNTIIDDDAGESYSENASTGISDLAESSSILDDVSTGIESAEAGAEVAEATASATPWGLLAIANQQLGSAVSSAHVSGLQQQSLSDYTTNMQQHGLNVGLNADLIKSNQESSIMRQQTGGSLGSFLGPIGAIVGQAIAGYNSVDQSSLRTAASFDGWVNPQQTGIVASLSTAGDSGESTQVDNVDTTNA